MAFENRGSVTVSSFGQLLGAEWARFRRARGLVIGLYIPRAGYYRHLPWAGFGVLCGYALLAFALGAFGLHRRNA